VISSNKRTSTTHERKTREGQETARTDTVTEVLQQNQLPLDPKISKQKLRERGEARDKDEDEGAAHLSRETADTVGNLAT
jgi:DNA anti-recombination protein RmuC